MNIRFKDRIFHAVCLSLILVIIILTANYIAAITHSWANHTQNDIIRRILAPDETVQAEVITPDEKTIDIAKKYSLALLDATIAFEDLPSYDAKIFLSIVRTLPDDVEIREFTFSENKLTIACVSDVLDSYQLFSANLLSEDYFAKVVATAPTSETDGYFFTITLYF